MEVQLVARLSVSPKDQSCSSKKVNQCIHLFGQIEIFQRLYLKRNSSGKLESTLSFMTSSY